MSKDNLITCKTWKKTKKCRIDCPFRHSTYHEVKQRKDIMCYWEDKGGCTKYRCEYKHNDPLKDEWKEVRVKSLNEIIQTKSTIERLNAEACVEIDLENIKKEKEVDISNSEEFVAEKDTTVNDVVETIIETKKRAIEEESKLSNEEDVKRYKNEIVYEDIDEEIKELDKELEELDDILKDTE
ncbi:Zinc finger CCCH domain-containing protein 11A [Nosema granulosis]|uniref:Zinc finger CCCH domain-containing protein 11A n=1 Tax=Nosema granulosis TaxID=83296 RepID=A0A9P6GXE3_9MICR|nr:Zinc finger CCCH domain-containing protein 11A [Nosema granulosis]